MDKHIATEKIRYLRKTIDNLDAALIHILAERYRCTDQVGVLKAQFHLSAVDSVRESEQARNINDISIDAGVNPEIVHSLFRLIIDEVVRRHKNTADDLL